MSEKRFLSSKEVAIFLGLSKPTVDRMVAKGTIPNYKVGKRRLFDREELIEWVKSHKEPGPPAASPKRPKTSQSNESHPGPSSTPKSGQKSKKERR